MNSATPRARRLHCPRALAVLVVLVWVALTRLESAHAADGIVTADKAERQIGQEPWRTVSLPDWPLDPPVTPEPDAVRYKISVPSRPAGSPGLLMEGMLANGSISFNGHLLRASTDPAGRTLPRGLDRMTVLSMPAGLWKPDGNIVEIEALPQRRMSISRAEFGELSVLTRKHRVVVLTHFISPLVAGGVVGTLGLAMLALGVRMRDTSFLLFAVGALAWWLVNWMPLFAWPPIGGPTYAIAWISLFGVVVAAFAAFCLRLANWYRPRMEKSLMALAAVGPLLLAGAYAIDQMDLASTIWRLLLIVGMAVALAAVVRAYWQTRTRSSLAMVGCGAVALALGALDWLADLDETSNHALALTTYAGLAFAAAATALLVERYIDASRSGALLRGQLEDRVKAQGTQLRQALKDMEVARDAARSADRAKSSFLAVASHDLRQPAHAIGLYVEAMPSHGLEAEQTEVLERLRQAHSALERMFDALLDMSQIDAGTLVPQRRNVEPWELMQRLADEAAPAAEVKGLRLALRAGESAVGVQAYTDPVLLERMLRNLIGNAVKYTGAGGVLLACRVRAQGGTPQLRLEVWDTGPGIDLAHRDRIFEEFFRVSPGHGAAEGLGLGLPIVKRLAQLLGVQVGLRSRPGHGSCFHLALELAPATPMKLTAQAPSVAPSLAGLRVGVIEDDPMVRDAMVRVLRRWDCRVVAGESAMDLIDASAMDGQALELLIVDYRLSGDVSGPAEARAYSAASAAAPKVLVVTGEQSPERLKHLAALQLPWLPKPISTAALKGTIADLLAPQKASSGG